MAALKPVQLVAGDTWRDAWALADEALIPIDLTGASARLHVRDAAGLLVAEASTADGRLTIDGPAGIVRLRLPPAATNLPVGSYRYALELTYDDATPELDATVETIETNTLSILPDIARDEAP
jgi:hypothetical protein